MSREGRWPASDTTLATPAAALRRSQGLWTEQNPLRAPAQTLASSLHRPPGPLLGLCFLRNRKLGVWPHLHRVKAPPRAREGRWTPGELTTLPHACSSQGRREPPVPKQRRQGGSRIPVYLGGAEMGKGSSWGRVGGMWREGRGGGHGGGLVGTLSLASLCMPAWLSPTHKCGDTTEVPTAHLGCRGALDTALPLCPVCWALSCLLSPSPAWALS